MKTYSTYRFLASLLLLVLATNCSQINPNQPRTSPISHAIFDELLHSYVDKEGLVDYEGLITEREKLSQYLKVLSDNAPNDENWNREEQLAYWINAYNAFTIALVLDHYPIKSIKDIGSSIQVPFINTPWDIKFVNIAGQKYDLNNIEHNILRKKWEEPLIHFAINCASMSCPKLRSEAYSPKELEKQLDDQASQFINDDFRNDITSEKAEISKIFKWFSGDFEKNSNMKSLINQYADQKILPNVEIEFKDYDWGLNNQNRTNN